MTPTIIHIFILLGVFVGAFIGAFIGVLNVEVTLGMAVCVIPGVGVILGVLIDMLHVKKIK
jgi:hypothetical protein